MNNAYIILGVSKDATDEAIKNAWRALVFACHPDVSQEPCARMIDINAAYECLKTKDRRKEHDQALGYQTPEASCDEIFDRMNSFFNDLFGCSKSPQET